MRLVYCCCCGKDISEYDTALVSITYNIPGEPQDSYLAVVCFQCSMDYEKHAPVIEALINARLARVQYPDKKFKPE